MVAEVPKGGKFLWHKQVQGLLQQSLTDALGVSQPQAGQAAAIVRTVTARYGSCCSRFLSMPAVKRLMRPEILERLATDAGTPP